MSYAHAEERWARYCEGVNPFNIDQCLEKLLGENAGLRACLAAALSERDALAERSSLEARRQRVAASGQPSTRSAAPYCGATKSEGLPQRPPALAWEQEGVERASLVWAPVENRDAIDDRVAFERGESLCGW
eukprot:RCo032212